MQRILVLSDDTARVAALGSALRQDGHDVRAEASIERCLIAARDWRPALVILDLDLGFTSRSLASVLADAAVAEHVGTLALAGPEHLPLVGPGVKVDDFILSPVDDQELCTRVARILRAYIGAEDGAVLRHGPLEIDLERYRVTVDGAVVDLTYKEYELLRFLATNPGKPFTREALLNRVWGYDYYGGSRTVDVHVRRIRSKIEGRQEFIETVRNVGYRFIEQGR